MNEIASKSQLRLSYFRWALFCVTIILLLGWTSGLMANSGNGNHWFAALQKPALMPPGATFAIVWSILYILLGLSVAVVLNARGAPGRGLALTLFVVGLLCNFAWSPLFFAAHEVKLAFYLICAMLVLGIVTMVLFARVRQVAALLLAPYLLWLVFAAYLNFGILTLNPGAETLVAPAINTQI